MTDQDKINELIFPFIIFALTQNTGSNRRNRDVFRKLQLLKLTNKEILSCEGIISEDEVEIINHLEMMDSLKNNMNASGMKS